MDKKTKQLIVHLIKNHKNSSVTSLMKLAYLSDLICIKRIKKQITSFEYKRYTFGPFDEKIYECLEELMADNIIIANSDYSMDGKEYLVYSVNNESENFPLDEISENELGIVDDLLETTKGYGAKALTDIAYKTKPMEALGATQGGLEAMGEKLDLKAE